VQPPVLSVWGSGSGAEQGAQAVGSVQDGDADDAGTDQAGALVPMDNGAFPVIVVGIHALFHFWVSWLLAKCCVFLPIIYDMLCKIPAGFQNIFFRLFSGC
jgi:hypothetical protein